MMLIAERFAQAKLVADAKTFDEEQAALQGLPTIDVLCDLPQDRGKLWALHVHNFGPDEQADYYAVTDKHHLPWERGARRHYVDQRRLVPVGDALREAGFIVTLSLDAAITLNEQGD